ncbi:response regulator transcription factor [uncultured Azohydromonas sp.]|jgi:Response regulator containing a CheY-like receiver domain and an HTH DNA-binding domain|uniref:response regulator n=1 Tax=uncultured Azohydromonas sp. TaxID=487342 RepID=UPI002639141E|nr:response regulator transcription factor [uncultured Azohydromonas sp.]
MSAGALRIGLVDDHAVVRAGYRRLLELEGMAVAAEFADADSAYAALSAGEHCPVDLLILDLSLPGRSGLELLRRLSVRRPDLKVLVFTMHDSAATVAQCLRAGAAGFVTKSSAPEELIEAVHRAWRGELALSPDVAQAARQAAEPAPHLQLSTREFDVLQALLRGASVEEISQQLRLSPKTVANYQTLVRQKLGVSNAVELLRYAREHGLVG